MPFSKTPVINTYETKRVNFVSNLLQRSSDSSKDFRLVNMMTEAIPTPVGQQTKVYTKSRPGMVTAFTTQTGEGRGLFYWTVGGVGYAMAVVGNKVYANGTEVLTLTTSTGLCGMTEHLSSVGAVSLILLDGTKGYVFSTPTTPVEITSVNFPSPHIPTPVVLDAYLFVAKQDSNDIYNSNLDDPLTWSTGDFISAEMYPDKIVALSKNNNYLYAVGSSSVEYFADIANATGSPLGRQQSAVQQFGTAAVGTVVQTEREVIFVGETNDGGHTVWIIDGFKEHEVGIPAVKYALLAEDGNIPNARGFAVRAAGQKFYVLCLTLRTYVYSFDNQMWSEWTTGSSIFTGQCGSDGPNGSAYILDKSNGNVYKMDETYFTDAGTPITCTIQTSKYDFDSINRKFMHRLSLIGDVPDSTLVDSAVSVSWSDDDYKTWSTPRTLKFTADLPSIFQLGSFRRRAFRLSYALPHLLRLEGAEADINKGSA